MARESRTGGLFLTCSNSFHFFVISSGARNLDSCHFERSEKSGAGVRKYIDLPIFRKRFHQISRYARNDM